MMKILISFLLTSMLLTSLNNSDMNEVKTNFNLAVQDKNISKKMMEKLEQYNEKSSVYLAYLGGYQTIWANHVFNPSSKLQTFNKGKKNIELAVKNAPDNIEIRYIRFSVQKNAPSFLGYNSHLKEDKDFLVKNKKNINSDFVQKNIETLLK
ncbi:MAG TPA: hypothetical protein PKU77_12490 [Ferruginibacter sp.]|nr:hypothetical protein [Ferruginibacter sp.]